MKNSQEHIYNNILKNLRKITLIEIIIQCNQVEIILGIQDWFNIQKSINVKAPY